jgi:hypothetical protein
MTKPVRVYSKTPFSQWVRIYGPDSEANTDAIDIEDIDYIVFGYLTGDLMTLEEKQNGATSSDAQGDTHHVVTQMLRLASGKVVDTQRGPRAITYRGHHLIQFDKTGPEDGGIRVDGKAVTKEELARFINFGKPLTNHRTPSSRTPPVTQPSMTSPKKVPAEKEQLGPTYPGPVCHSNDWWWREPSEYGCGAWICNRCHPKPKGRMT